MDSSIIQALNRALQGQDRRQGVITMNQRTYDSVMRHLNGSRNPFVPAGATATWGAFTLVVDDALGDGAFRFSEGSS